MKQMMMEADLLVQCQLVNDSFQNVSFPSKIFEYIATNNYVISSKVADITEFSKDEIIYYDNDDPKELANKIIDIYNMYMNGNTNKNRFEKLCNENFPEAVGKNIVDILN